MRLDEHAVAARIERLTLRELRVWVGEGLVRPVYAEGGPVYDDIDVARLRLLCDLRKDMALPADVLPVVLSLIDHLHRTRRDLRHLAEALDEQSPDVRRAVLRSVQSRNEKQR